jgi:parallel beta-helix repeat protein
MSTDAAQASHVACGDFVTADVTLDSDLIDCPGNGLLIRASGVTVDLGGHTIDGTGSGLGVVTLPRVAHATIRNGTVRQFHDAIVVDGRGHVIRDCTVAQSHDGILLSAVFDGLVENVSAWGNDGSGINAPEATRVAMVRNHLFDNAAGVGGVSPTDSLIAHNLVERNTFYGIRFFAAAGTTFERNSVDANGDFGIFLEEALTGNRILRNRVSRTGGDGIRLEEQSGSNVLERNSSDRNTDDGFDIAGPGATLVRNSAARNGDLGFDAPLGVALAERNKTRHNGNPAECAGISCR